MADWLMHWAVPVAVFAIPVLTIWGDRRRSRMTDAEWLARHKRRWQKRERRQQRRLPAGVLSTEKAKTVEQLQRERIGCARCGGRGTVSILVAGTLGHAPCPECNA